MARPRATIRERRVEIFAERTTNMFFVKLPRQSKRAPVMAYRIIATTAKEETAPFPNILRSRREREQRNWTSPHLTRRGTPIAVTPGVENRRVGSVLKSKAAGVGDVDNPNQFELR